MAYPQGIDFRFTSGYVADPTNCDYEITECGGSGTPEYPRTTAQGNTVGYESVTPNTSNPRDKSTTNDHRLAGVHFTNSGGTQINTYRLDLPSTGNYNVYIAAGDQVYSRPTKVEAFDTTSSLGVLCSGSTGAGNSFRDAANNIRTAAAWVSASAGGGTAAALTFATTICRIKYGDGTANPCCLAHIFIESAGGGGGTNITPPQGSLVINGQVPSVAQTANQFITPPVGAVVINGQVPTVFTSDLKSITAGVGSLVFNGQVPTVTVSIGGQINVPTGAVTFTGQTPTLTQTANVFQNPLTGALVFQGQAPSVSVDPTSPVITADVGALLFVGQVPTVVNSGDNVGKIGGDDVPRRKSPEKGFDLKAWKKKQGLWDDVEETIKGEYAALTGQAKVEALKVVSPHIETGKPNLPEQPAFVIDWAAAARDKEVSAKLKELKRIQDEEDAIFTILMMDDDDAGIPSLRH